RSGQDQLAARAKEPRELLQRVDRRGDVLKHLDAKESVEGSVGLGDRSDIADDVELRSVPLAHLKPGAVAHSVVAAEVLAHVAEVRAESLVLKLARAGVQDAGS